MNLIVPRILWAALTFSTVIYAIIPNFIQRPAALEQRMLLMAFAVVAVIVGIASHILPRQLFKIGLERLRLEVVDDLERLKSLAAARSQGGSRPSRTEPI